MQPTVHRRDVLAGVAGSGLVALAGCTDLPTGQSNQGSRPGYHRYVPAQDAGGEPGTFFVSLDIAGLRELDASSGDLGEQLPGDVNFDSSEGLADADPLVAYPAVGVFAAALGIAFGLVPYGFGDQVLSGFMGDGGDGSTQTPTATESGASVDDAVLLEGTFVLEGSFDPAAIGDAAEGFERTDERDGYEVYEGTDEGDSFMDTSNLAFAVSESTIVALTGDEGEGRTRLDAVLDTAAGAGDRLSDDGDGDWALRTAGDGLVTLGGFGIEPDEAGDSSQGQGFEVESVFERADGLVSSLDIGDERASGTIAAVFPDGETPSQADIEAEVGTSASERDVTVDGTRVTVTGTWEYEAGTATDGGS